MIVHGIHDASEDDAAARLLERVAVLGDPMLRDVLLEIGAREVVREVRP